VTITLHASFRTIGWRWPFRNGDVLEIWRGTDQVAELSAELLASLVVHYLVGHDLLRQFDAAALPAAAEIRRPLARVTVPAPARAVYDASYRKALRAQRRARAKAAK